MESFKLEIQELWKKEEEEERNLFLLLTLVQLANNFLFIFLYFKVKDKLELLKYFILIKFKNISENNYVSI